MTLLDLVITLTEPPKDAPPDTLAQYELTCPALGRQHANGLLVDPLDAPTRAELRWYLEESWLWPFDQFAERARQLEQRLEPLGHAFYTALFDTVEAQRIVQPWQLQPKAERQLSLELSLSQ
ncbi:MAG: hypothetical protein WCP31_06070 [Chloroflexales bacterium]